MWLGGQLLGPLLWLQVGGWGLQKKETLRLQRTRPPASLSLRRGNLQGLSGFERRGAGRDTALWVKRGQGRTLSLNSSRMLFLDTLTHQPQSKLPSLQLTVTSHS